MRLPEGPFLEVSFYSAHLAEQVVFHRLIDALVDFDASFAGRGWVHRGENIQNLPFGGITDEPREPVPIATLEDLDRWLDDPNARLVQAEINRASGLTHDVTELVTYVRISDAAARVDHHPVAIWTDGWLFSDPLVEEEIELARRAGLDVYHRFLALIERLEPSYAALTIEYPLKCPTDLRAGSESRAFRNFFVNADFLGGKRFARVRALFERAYVEPRGTGVYISCTGEFNPMGISLPVDHEVVRQVTELIVASR